MGLLRWLLVVKILRDIYRHFFIQIFIVNYFDVNEKQNIQNYKNNLVEIGVKIAHLHI